LFHLSNVFTQVHEVSHQQYSLQENFTFEKMLVSMRMQFHNHVDSRHTTSETFRKGNAMCIRYQILNAASAQGWDFTA